MKEHSSLAIAACARVMRPLVRLAVAMGVKYGPLEALLRDLLIEEAQETWRNKGVPKPTVSQVAITTGLNRKKVTLLIRRDRDVLPSTEESAASRTFTLWKQRAAEDPAYLRLFTVAGRQGPSFEAVAQQASHGDMHHRTVLEELVRLGLAREADGQVELTAEGFVPLGDRRGMLAFLGDNNADHLMAAISNTLGQSTPFLERAVFADGMTRKACEDLQLLARQQWSAMHHALVDQMTLAVDEVTYKKTMRMRVGVYAYFEETDPPPATRD